MLQGARPHGSGARDANKKVPGWQALLEFLEFRNLPVGVCVEHFANNRQFFRRIVFRLPAIYRFSQPSVSSGAPPKSKSPA